MTWQLVGDPAETGGYTGPQKAGLGGAGPASGNSEIDGLHALHLLQSQTPPARMQPRTANRPADIFSAYKIVLCLEGCPYLGSHSLAVRLVAPAALGIPERLAQVEGCFGYLAVAALIRSVIAC